MGTVAITGAGGYIGQGLIKLLDGMDSCSSIMAVDIKKPPVHSGKLTFIKKDIRD